MERQDTPLFLTGSERKVNLASLKMAFFFRRVRRRKKPLSLSAVSRICGISRKEGFSLFSGLLAGKVGKQVFQFRHAGYAHQAGAHFLGAGKSLRISQDS